MLTPGAITDTAHTYADNGLYLVTLTVEEEPGDGSAPFDTETFQILVDNVQPLVAAGDDATANEGLDTSFGLGSFTDPGDDDPWTVNVDWGDGSPDTNFTVDAAGSLGSASHTYADNATYVVEVTVREDNGTGASDSNYLHRPVNNVARPAPFAASSSLT